MLRFVRHLSSPVYSLSFMSISYEQAIHFAPMNWSAEAAHGKGIM